MLMHWALAAESLLTGYFQNIPDSDRASRLNAFPRYKGLIPMGLITLDELR